MSACAAVVSEASSGRAAANVTSPRNARRSMRIWAVLDRNGRMTPPLRTRAIIMRRNTFCGQVKRQTRSGSAGSEERLLFRSHRIFGGPTSVIVRIKFVDRPPRPPACSRDLPAMNRLMDAGIRRRPFPFQCRRWLPRWDRRFPPTLKPTALNLHRGH